MVTNLYLGEIERPKVLDLDIVLMSKVENEEELDQVYDLNDERNRLITIVKTENGPVSVEPHPDQGYRIFGMKKLKI